MASVRGTRGKRIGLNANVPKNALKIYWEIPVFSPKNPLKKSLNIPKLDTAHKYVAAFSGDRV